MARKWLRFPLRSEEQLRIQTSPINVLDGGPTFPDWMRLEFTIFDPSQGAPAVMPFFPGTLRFYADPQAPGVIPKPTDTFSWTTAQFDTWKTVGTLVVELDPTLISDIAALPGAPSPAPTIAWYWPVRLPEAFLFEAIRNHLDKRTAVKRPGVSVATDAPTWANYAVAGFIAGDYAVPLRRPADPLKDDAVQFRTMMPTVDMTATGEVGLWIGLAAGTLVDDKQQVPTIAGTTAVIDPRHPENALLPTNKTLTDLAPQMLGAEQPGSVLAAAALSAWPAGPRYFQIAFTAPGPRQLYRSGLLPTQEITVRDGAGAVLQQRRLSTDGLVTIAQLPATPTPDPMQCSVTIASNALRIGETTGSRAGLGPNEITFDFAALASPARISLQPPAPSPLTAPSKQAYSAKLARLCIGAALAPTTKDDVAKSLAEYEGTIRPSGWLESDLVFRGTRFPWKGSPDNQVPLGEADLMAVFNAVQKITVTGATPPIVRPGEALILWLMEGRIDLLSFKLLSIGTATPWKPLLGSFPTNAALQPFDAVKLGAAANADVTKLVRTKLLWGFFGLDELTDVAWNSAAQDTLLAWTPAGTPTLADSIATHDRVLANGLAAISARGISRPNMDAITNSIKTRTVGGVTEFQLLPAFIETYIWLQYAEYLRRLVACTDPTQTGIHPAMPVAARDYPAFSYIAFNAFKDVERAAEYWARANAVLAAPPFAWVKTPEDALRSWRLVNDPPPNNEITRTPRGGRLRSTAVRVNGLHFAALVRSFGAVFPRVLYPVG